MSFDYFENYRMTSRIMNKYNIQSIFYEIYYWTCICLFDIVVNTFIVARLSYMLHDWSMSFNNLLTKSYHKFLQNKILFEIISSLRIFQYFWNTLYMLIICIIYMYNKDSHIHISIIRMSTFYYPYVFLYNVL